MVAGLAARAQSSTVRAYVLATLAVLPLLAPALWSGFRLALTDPVLAVFAPSEQPLSVRSLAGVWAMGLALGWFGLAYRRRQCSAWEVGLVLIGGAAALARVGNAWLDAAAMLVPLGRQLSATSVKPFTQIGLAALSLGVAGAIVAASRPHELPPAGRDAAATAAASTTVLADWRWAPALQRELGDNRQVLASHGLAAESTDFWLDYLRVIQGHERWATVLNGWHVDLLVLDASDQQAELAELVRASSDWRVMYDANGTLVARRASP